MIIAGLDEVGRGSFAGPMMAACAAFWCSGEQEVCGIPDVRDSKEFKKDRARRREAFNAILRSDMVDFGVGFVTPKEIDERGVIFANQLAFHRAVCDLGGLKIDLLITDGEYPLVAGSLPIAKQRCYPKADANYWQVSAASILAKVIHDEYMDELAEQHGQYDWKNNAGYGSKKHREALVSLGPTIHHRHSFLKSVIRQSAG
jgi:ribonuclease HII